MVAHPRAGVYPERREWMQTTVERARTLNSRFGMAGVVFRDGPGSLESVEVENRHATAKVALQGAQLLSWTPRDEEPVLWMSEAARFEPGVPVRGGIPICWPWLGAHPADPSLPRHGIARTAAFQVIAVERLFDDRTRLAFRLPDGQGASAWPHQTELLYLVTVGRALELDLVTRNTGKEVVTLEQSLHTYLRVSDHARVTVHGFEGSRYLDRARGGEKVQDRPLAPGGEIDRTYLDSVRDCVVEDPGLSRAIRIGKRNSHTTVVWNPGLEGAAPERDFGPSGAREMLCVETANAASDAVRLQPHAVHLLYARISLEPVV
jgi:glucose-6-phosphate 1-epimerase